MELWNVVSVVAGGVMTIVIFFLHRQGTRIDRFERDVNDMRVELARQRQENKGLAEHIRRIDKNLDDLFKKVEEILNLFRKNGK